MKTIYFKFEMLCSTTVPMYDVQQYIVVNWSSSGKGGTEIILAELQVRSSNYHLILMKDFSSNILMYFMRVGFSCCCTVGCG